MTGLLLPALFAVALWWLGTGVLLILVRQPRARHARTLLAATAVLVAALVGIVATSAAATVQSAYVAFACSVLVWAWIELTFLMGYVTGPRTAACPLGSGGWRRFWSASATLIHHELLLLAVGAVVLALSLTAANPVAAWTFAVLWVMRLSAKLNLFLGVRNHFGEFLPEHLRYLESYFRRRAVNLLFPVVVSAATAVAAALWVGAFAQPPGFAAVALALTATLLSLAVLEHWFLILPLPAAALWHWSAPRTPAEARGVADAAPETHSPAGPGPGRSTGPQYGVS